MWSYKIINNTVNIFENGILKNKSQTDLKTINALKKVSGITVNKVHGNERSIEKLLQQPQTTNLGHTVPIVIGRSRSAQTESMEGAAFSYTCMMLNIRHFQIRAISNYIEKRNRSSWKIEDALKNLEKILLKVLEDISHN